MGGNRGWVGRVVISFNVRICERLVQATDDGLKIQLWVSTSKSVGKDISSGNLDGLLEKIVFEDDETSVQRRNIPHDVFPVLDNLGRCNSSRMDIEVCKASVIYAQLNQRHDHTSGVKSGSGADAGPHDRFQPHRQGNSADSVINVTERGPHCIGRDAQDILDDLLGPSKLRDDLFVGQGGERSGVTPSMHGDVVLGHVLDLKEGRGGNGARTNDKERGLERMLVKEVQEIGSVERGTVIVCETPGILCGTSANIRVADASTTRPPTAAGICGGLSIGRASSSYSGVNGGDLDAGCLDFSNPLLNLWAVGGRNGVQLGVIRRREGRDWVSPCQERGSDACGLNAYCSATEAHLG